MKRRTYIIDDRRYVANARAEQNRLGHDRIHEIVAQIPDFRATVKTEGNEKTAVIREILAPNGSPIPAADLPPLIHDVTLPEILADMKCQALPRGRRMPLSVVEIQS